MTRRPLLLDLFCCEGGAATGYHRAGFDVVGIDIDPQPNYPFTFLRGDAVVALANLVDGYEVGGYHLSDFDAIHASPPCQLYSVSTVMHRDANEYPDLVDTVRELLTRIDIPWVIENVMGAPLVPRGHVTFDGRYGEMLCGSMFSMKRLRRHRLFETNWPLSAPSSCRHSEQEDVMSIVGHGEQGRSGRVGERWGLAARREVMGMTWASRDGISEAIPPAYTEWIGRQMVNELAQTVTGRNA